MKEHFDNATPKRLILKEGAWTLELEALVPLGDTILRPTTYSVEGPELILTMLERNPNVQELAMGANQLMDQARALGPSPMTMAFEARGNAWIPAPPPVAGKPKASEDEEGEEGGVRARMGARRKDLMILVGRIETLEARIAELEASVARLSSATPARRESVPDAPAARPQPGTKRPTIRMPAVSDIEDALKILVGDGISVTEASEQDMPALDETARGYTISRLLDETDRMVGAVIADVRSVVYQSGVLLDSTPAAMKIQIQAEEPADDALEAWSEIVNNLCGLFNKIEGNPLLRPTTAAAFDASNEPWIASILARADFIDSYQGRLVLVITQ